MQCELSALRNSIGDIEFFVRRQRNSATELNNRFVSVNISKQILVSGPQLQLCVDEGDVWKNNTQQKYLQNFNVKLFNYMQ